jgi:hypothetical protein
MDFILSKLFVYHPRQKSLGPGSTFRRHHELSYLAVCGNWLQIHRRLCTCWLR